MLGRKGERPVVRLGVFWLVALGAACVAALLAPHGPYGVILLPAAALIALAAGRWLRSLVPGVTTIAVVDLVGLIVLIIARPDLLLSRGISGQLAVLLAVALPWWLGRLRQSAVDRVHREHVLIDQRARASERALIAADMHDALGHDLALIALQAGALELAQDQSGDQADARREAAAAIRRQATAATDRLQVSVGLLREGAGDSVGATGLEGLVDHARSAGLLIDHADLGQRRDTWSPPTARAVYRVLQESLTNAAKHAPGSDITIAIDDTIDPLRIEVTNTGGLQPASDLAPGRVSGSGLIALDERLRQLGGTLTAERRRGGFDVRATLPGNAEGGAVEDGPRVIARTLRRQQRRSVRRAAILPVVLALIIASALSAAYVATFVQTGLTPAHYGQIAVGDRRADIRGLLPPHSQSGPTPTLVVPPAPAAARCEYYLDRSMVLKPGVDMFRLCFDDHGPDGAEIVVSKDRLTERRS
ncbi:histidine kinase [Saxibacter everestensis]|uniref:histidine kinase n=1 Tax=Saxibacter everestensis TaxID=2909229 RepID=A0ABY8QU95_9MICO|nr:histidine kinase [Brevibacteriaceae bacterium ZFBP1038]